MTGHERPTRGSGGDPIVVVGSGLAGLTAAWAVAPTPCVLITPQALTDGSASMWAQGGIAAAIGLDDSVELHVADTWAAGAEAGDRAAIERIIGAGPAAISDLVSLGVEFDTAPGGGFDLHLEAGHQRHRIAHVADASGAAITSAVARVVAQMPHVTVLGGTRVVDLLVDAGTVRGVRVASGDASSHGDLREVPARAVIMATGGYGALWPASTSPLGSTGSGIALGARAGARTDDLHLVQFHPTGLDAGMRPVPLLTEALRGAGAVLLADGERFVDELLPRDIVAAAVWQQRHEGRAVALDARGISDVEGRFPTVTHLCASVGLSPARDLLPVRPAAHYTIGGLTVDACARTSLPGLYAVGETSRTGLHGANRLASNSLLEACVTGRVAAAHARTWQPGTPWESGVPAAAPDAVVCRAAVPPASGQGPASAPEGLVGEALDAGCGVLRDADGLQRVIDRLAPYATSDDAAYLGWLVARSALADTTSRGVHRRLDTAEAASVPSPAPVGA